MLKKLILGIVLFSLYAIVNAAVIIDVSDQTGDVVFDISGSLDLTGATPAQSGAVYDPGFIPGGSNWYIASGGGGEFEGYAFTSFDGPFGTSTSFFNTPTSTSGDNFLIWGQGGFAEQLAVGPGYQSGDSINSQIIFAGATIAGFTMIAGTYNYLLPSDTLTLNIGAVVPEPSIIALFGLGLLGLGFARRRKA